MKKIIVITTMLLLSSCAGLTQKTGNQELFNDSKISQLKKGKTTKSEIVSMFGTPHSGEHKITEWNSTEEETLMMYYASHIQTSPWVLFPIIGHVIMLNKEDNGTASKQRTLNVTLNENNLLKDYDYKAQDK